MWLRVAGNSRSNQRLAIAARHLLTSRFSSQASSVSGLRIAVVGGGVAGLATTLHLAPLVSRGLIEKVDLYHDNEKSPREIGVGVWSTALEPFSSSSRRSHVDFLRELQHVGRWLGKVGYKTPAGSWLATSSLADGKDIFRTDSGSKDNTPGLLFLREADLFSSLQHAIETEAKQGTVRMFNNTQVSGFPQHNDLSQSAPLLLQNGTQTEQDYHLVVAADGMQSNLRQLYGGYSCRKRMLYSESKRMWDASSQAQANTLEDRNYYVFRGNSHLSVNDVNMDGYSFQTWGCRQSQRFAAVPMSFPRGSTRSERHVWFLTTSDSTAWEEDPSKRKDKLLKQMQGWHDPIRQLIEATPANEILMEHAIAHKYSVRPVFNVNAVLQHLHSPNTANQTKGPGPTLVFLGDAQMTVDPVLAQGFTVAMEDAASLSKTLEPIVSNLEFDRDQMKQALIQRNEAFSQRLLCLLRATELVQSMAQPNSTIASLLTQYLVHPAMWLSPDFIKKPMFDAVAKYSLGLFHKTTQNDKGNNTTVENTTSNNSVDMA